MVDLGSIEHLRLRGGAERVAELDRGRVAVALHREIAPVAQPNAIGDSVAGAPADRRRAHWPASLLRGCARLAVGPYLRGVLPLRLDRRRLLPLLARP